MIELLEEMGVGSLSFSTHFFPREEEGTEEEEGLGRVETTVWGGWVGGWVGGWIEREIDGQVGGWKDGPELFRLRYEEPGRGQTRGEGCSFP